MEEPSAVVVVAVGVIVVLIAEVVVSCRRSRSSRGPPRGGLIILPKCCKPPPHARLISGRFGAISHNEIIGSPTEHKLFFSGLSFEYAGLVAVLERVHFPLG